MRHLSGGRAPCRVTVNHSERAGDVTRCLRPRQICPPHFLATIIRLVELTGSGQVGEKLWSFILLTFSLFKKNVDIDDLTVKLHKDGAI